MYVLNVNIVNMKNICIRLYVFKKKKHEDESISVLTNLRYTKYCKHIHICMYNYA